MSNSESHAHTHRWNTLETIRGSFGPEDFAPEIIEIKFERPVPIKVGNGLKKEQFFNNLIGLGKRQVRLEAQKPRRENQ